MRRYILLYTLVVYGTIAFCQKECDELIFAVEGNKVINDCCIKNVFDGNIVEYLKDGETLWITAAAIFKDGTYTELVSCEEIMSERYVKRNNKPGLYCGHDYYYYKQLYDVSKTRQVIGIMVTSIGLGIELFGLVNNDWEDGSGNSDIFAQDITRACMFYISIGVPLWISGAVRAGNNKRAMEEIELTRSLAIGFNSYGVGLTYRF